MRRRDGLLGSMRVWVLAGLVAGGAGIAWAIAGWSATSRPVYERGSIYVVSAAGGRTEAVTHDAKNHQGVFWSPDSKYLVDAADAGVEVRDRDGHLLHEAATPPNSVMARAAWAPVGHGFAYTVASDNGQTVSGGLYVVFGSKRARELAPLATGLPSWSPDGRHLAFIEGLLAGTGPARGQGCGPATKFANLAVVSVDGSTRTRLVCNIVSVDDVEWSPTRDQILYAVAARDGQRSLWVAALGRPRPRRLVDGFLDLSARWSPDGRRVALSATRGPTDHHVYIVSARGGRVRQLGPWPTTNLAWSPDSRLLAITNPGSATDQLLSVNPDTGTIRLITELTGREITSLDWSRDGQRLALTAQTPKPQD